MCEENKSIGVFIDGGYFAKVNESLEEQLSMNIHITSHRIGETDGSG